MHDVVHNEAWDEDADDVDPEFVAAMAGGGGAGAGVGAGAGAGADVGVGGGGGRGGPGAGVDWDAIVAKVRLRGPLECAICLCAIEYVAIMLGSPCPLVQWCSVSAASLVAPLPCMPAVCVLFLQDQGEGCHRPKLHPLLPRSLVRGACLTSPSFAHCLQSHPCKSRPVSCLPLALYQHCGIRTVQLDGKSLLSRVSDPRLRQARADSVMNHQD